MAILHSIEQPIMVMGMSRSGTSLVSGILEAHGVWFGTNGLEHEYNIKGDYVNKGINDVITGNIDKKNLDKLILEEIKRQGYQKGPWSYKISVKENTAKRLDIIFKPQWVLVRRNIEDMFASRMRMRKVKTGNIPQEFEDFKQRHEYKNWVMDYYRIFGGIDIWPKKIINKQYDELRQVLRKLGIQFSLSKTLSVVSPKHWHTVKA